ncbi:MAG: hypothetical protein IJC39_02520, partial [Firmicutes bacterium]|nr:hypothetical protein [Bacillota bacterium]
MKKAIALFLTICMAISLCACGGDSSASSPSAETETTAAEETTENAAPEPSESEQITKSPPAAKIKPLALKQGLAGHYEWNDDTAQLLVRSEYSYVTMLEEDAKKYPETAEALDQLSALQKRSMEEEFDNFLGFVREEAADGIFSDTYVSTLDVQVRRADSIAVSLLSDSYSDTAMVEDLRGMFGFNFDTKTGQELKLSDVILDMEKIPAIVEQELNSHLWTGNLYSETAVSDYFEDTSEDSISWTLDYNGVTFYFGDGELAEKGNGRQSATVLFAAHPELFNKKYTEVPEGYIVSLPLDHSFFADLDGDKDLEELICSGYFDPDMGMYSSFGIYTDKDGHYHYEDLFADGFDPYYVKTADGKHYIYLFCMENEGMFGLGHLVVYDVTDGALNRTGEQNAAPFYLFEEEENARILPTNPEEIWLDDPDYGNDGTVFAVGKDGMPQTERENVSEGASEIISENTSGFDTDALDEIAFDELSLEGTDWYGYVVVDPQSGEEIYLPYTDEEAGYEVGAKLELYEDG